MHRLTMVTAAVLSGSGPCQVSGPLPLHPSPSNRSPGSWELGVGEYTTYFPRPAPIDPKGVQRPKCAGLRLCAVVEQRRVPVDPRVRVGKTPRSHGVAAWLHHAGADDAGIGFWASSDYATPATLLMRTSIADVHEEPQVREPPHVGGDAGIGRAVGRDVPGDPPSIGTPCAFSP
jgi:hypothetical protein